MGKLLEHLAYGAIGTFMVFGAAAGGGLVTYYSMQRPRPAIREVIKEKTKVKHVNLDDLTFRKTVNLSVKDNLESLLDGHIPFKSLGLAKGSKKRMDSAGKQVDIDKLAKRSNYEKPARDYITNMLKKIKKDVYDRNPGISDLELATKGMDVVWKDLTDSRYTYNSGSKGDSTKTLAEFLAGRKGRLRRINGDCKDFTSAFLSSYEIMREMAEKNRDSGPFYEKLFQGFIRYQVVGLCYDQKKGLDGKTQGGHCMIGEIKYSNTFLDFTISPLEPQRFGLRGKKDYFLTMIDGKLLLVDSRASDKTEIHHISRFHNSHGFFRYKPAK